MYMKPHESGGGGKENTHTLQIKENYLEENAEIKLTTLENKDWNILSVA